MDMTGIMGVISYGLDTVIGFFLLGVLVFWFIQDVTQKSTPCCAVTRSSGACGFFSHGRTLPSKFLSDVGGRVTIAAADCL